MPKFYVTYYEPADDTLETVEFFSLEAAQAYADGIEWGAIVRDQAEWDAYQKRLAEPSDDDDDIPF